MSLIGHFHTLVDDRIGSRVGDRCWAFADPYLKVRGNFLAFLVSLSFILNTGKDRPFPHAA